MPINLFLDGGNKEQEKVSLDGPKFEVSRGWRRAMLSPFMGSLGFSYFPSSAPAPSPPSWASSVSERTSTRSVLRLGVPTREGNRADRLPYQEWLSQPEFESSGCPV